MYLTKGSQLISLAGHTGPKTAQRYMSEGHINTIAICVSMYFKDDKGPTKNGRGLDLAHGPPVDNPCIKHPPVED